MSANGVFQSFSVKEAFASLMIDDDPTSLTGPTYGTPVKANVIQKVGFKKAAQQVVLIGDDSVFGIETYTDFMDLTFEHGRTGHELLETLQGGAHWLEPGASNYVLDDDNAPYVKIEARIDKIGKNGGDLWLIFYKTKFGELDRAANSREFGPNAWQAKAQLTDSQFPVIKSGQPTTKRAFYKEVERAAGAPLYAISSGSAPTLSSSVPVAASTTAVVSANIVLTMGTACSQRSVNKYTVLLAQGGTPVDCTVTLSVDGTTITIDPATNLTAATAYTVTITTAVRSVTDVAVPAPITLAFTTA